MDTLYPRFPVVMRMIHAQWMIPCRYYPESKRLSAYVLSVTWIKMEIPHVYKQELLRQCFLSLAAQNSLRSTWRFQLKLGSSGSQCFCRPTCSFFFSEMNMFWHISNLLGVESSLIVRGMWHIRLASWKTLKFRDASPNLAFILIAYPQAFWSWVWGSNFSESFISTSMWRFYKYWLSLAYLGRGSSH